MMAMTAIGRPLLRLLKRGYVRAKYSEPVTYSLYPLTPVSSHRLGLVKRKILVLDLDETLVHSIAVSVAHSPYTERIPSCVVPDFELQVTIDKNLVAFKVFKRPYVDKFLEIVGQWFDVVIFTAGIDAYGELIAERLDNNRGIFKKKFFRRHCTPESGLFSKDLSVISSDLSSIFILDNSPFAYKHFPHNAIEIKSWYYDPADRALLNLLPVLDSMRFVHDVRSVLCRNGTSVER